MRRSGLSGDAMVRFAAFAGDPVTVARSLLGQRLVRVEGGRRLAGIIVEVEAYLGARDRAAHTYNGRRTPRNESMYLHGGHVYVYFTYGMHHCMNVVCGRRDEGTAVLLRAIEPTEGLDMMFDRRAAANRPRDLCSGPGKLTRAFGIDRTQDGLDLRVSRELFIERPGGRPSIVCTPRIGVDYAGSWAKRRLRFLISENLYVSRR
jgi:DNA-3-methyladenine glycosylase